MSSGQPAAALEENALKLEDLPSRGSTPTPLAAANLHRPSVTRTNATAGGRVKRSGTVVRRGGKTSRTQADDDQEDDGSSEDQGDTPLPGLHGF